MNGYMLSSGIYVEKKDYISITYESLCKNPNKTMLEITKFLDIKSYEIDFKDFIKVRGNYITPHIKFFSKFIFRKMKLYFKEFAYKL